jgi:hypothetical protein
VQIDRPLAQQPQAEVVGPDQVTIDLPWSAAVSPFMYGYTLMVYSKYQTFSYSLRGTAAGMYKVMECINTSARGTPSPTPTRSATTPGAIRR